LIDETRPWFKTPGLFRARDPDGTPNQRIDGIYQIRGLAHQKQVHLCKPGVES
jgi:hypothetical protein